MIDHCQFAHYKRIFETNFFALLNDENKHHKSKILLTIFFFIHVCPAWKKSHEECDYYKSIVTRQNPSLLPSCSTLTRCYIES